MERTPLQENVVVITGAAGRLGRRLTEAFAAKGAKIAALDRGLEASIIPEGTEGTHVTLDLTDETQVRESFDAIIDRFGHIDSVVHAVGMWEGRPLLETSLADWQRVVDVNLTSTFLCFREAARRMQGRGGRLIAFASGQGLDGGVSEQAAYSASKAGVIRLVETMSEEFQKEAITTHAIAPSMILFEESGRKGVPASELIRLVLYLHTGETGKALNGGTIRAYGTLL